MAKYTLENEDQKNVVSLGGYIWRGMLAEGFTKFQMEKFSILSMQGAFENYRKVCYDYIDILNQAAEANGK